MANTASDAADTYRPRLHFTPPTGWMNDPNGLIWFEGEYHLFYQHLWPRHWGHAISIDLLHWTHLPLALYPDELGDIWSGSMVADTHDTSGFFDGGTGLVAVFTHHHETGHKQSLAFSRDRGRTWTKFAGNPILEGPLSDSRDPKVFWYAPGAQWVMLLTHGDRVAFYTSPNLKTWTFASTFGEGAGIAVWECPDIYALPVTGEPNRVKWILHGSWLEDAIFTEGQGKSGTRYFVGDFDGTTFTADAEHAQGHPLSYGMDDYAPVTWANAPDGRTLLLGWMNNWLYAGKTPTSPWCGAMTLPRELTLVAASDGLRLLQTPIWELQTLRGEPHVEREQILTPTASLRVSCVEEAYEIVVEIALGTAEEAGVRLHQAGGAQTVVGYERDTQTLFVDRRTSGLTDFHSAFPARANAPLPLQDDVVRLHIVVDCCSLEVFGGRGEGYMASLIFPTSAHNAVEIYCTGGEAVVSHCALYPLA